MSEAMFCHQCQEAAKGVGCTVRGVCGKSSQVSNLQDVLIYALKGISFYNLEAKKLDINTNEADKFIVDGLFATITNANFDDEYFVERIKKALEIREETKKAVLKAGGNLDHITDDAAHWMGSTLADFEAKAKATGYLAIENEDVRALRSLIVFGVKGMAAYVEHAFNLEHENNEIYEFMQTALVETLNDELTADDLVALTMKTGEYGVKAMALLDEANTSTYGHPEITSVNIGVKANPGILISGHDLRDMEQLLEQTEGTGVDVYTHSEMLPANYYPAFKKYSHFVGNYGNAWWKQDKEFETFNGPIVMTTNCLVPPKDSYKDRVYTTGSVGFPGLERVKENADGTKDFTAIIEHAKKCDAPVEIENGEIVGGFGHNQVFALADKVVDAVKTGAIRRFFVMAGCDGRMKSRDYYTEFAKELPQDTVILTAGCAKYKYNKLELGDIGGIPRILDAGQCNDSYSLALIALKLKEVFELNDINELPISYNIAWYEQKAVIVLLALLHLGVKDIHLGPTLPAFLSPNVINVLVENFGIGGITNVEDDMAMFLGETAEA